MKYDLIEGLMTLICITAIISSLVDENFGATVWAFNCLVWIQVASGHRNSAETTR